MKLITVYFVIITHLKKRVNRNSYKQKIHLWYYYWRNFTVKPLSVDFMTKKYGKQFFLLNEAFKCKKKSDIRVRGMFGSHSLFVDDACFGRLLDGDIYIKVIDEKFSQSFEGLIGEELRLPHPSTRRKDVGYTHYKKMDMSIRTKEIVDYITTTNFKVDNYRFGGKRPQVGSILSLPNMTTMEKRYFLKGNITTSQEILEMHVIDIYLSCREYLPESMKLPFMVKSYCTQKNVHHLTITSDEKAVLKETIDGIDNLIDSLSGYAEFRLPLRGVDFEIEDSNEGLSKALEVA